MQEHNLKQEIRQSPLINVQKKQDIQLTKKNPMLDMQEHANAEQKLQQEKAAFEWELNEKPKVFLQWQEEAMQTEMDSVEQQEVAFHEQSTEWQQDEFIRLSDKDRRYTAKQRETQYKESLDYYREADKFKKMLKGYQEKGGDDPLETLRIQETYYREVSKAKIKYIKATSENEAGETFLIESEEILCLQKIVDMYQKEGGSIDETWREEKIAALQEVLEPKVAKLRENMTRTKEKDI